MLAGERGGGGLVDDALHLQSGETACVPRGAAGLVAEIGGHADHRLLHRLAEVLFRILPELSQDEGGELLRAEAAAAERIEPVGAHAPLEDARRPVRMRDEPFSGDLADKNRAVLVHADDARRQIAAARVRDETALAVLPVCRETVGGAQIDTDDSAHESQLLSLF